MSILTKLANEKRLRDGVPLSEWIEKATEGLCDSSRERIRADIAEHVASSVQSAINDGDDLDHAYRGAIEALGNPAIARKQFAKSHILKSELPLLLFGTIPFSVLGCVLVTIFALDTVFLLLESSTTSELLVVREFIANHVLVAVTLCFLPGMLGAFVLARAAWSRFTRVLSRTLLIADLVVSGISYLTVGLVFVSFYIVQHDGPGFLATGFALIGVPQGLSTTFEVAIYVMISIKWLSEALTCFRLMYKCYRVMPPTIVIR